MRVIIIKECPNPSVPGEVLKVGTDTELYNPLARKLIEAGFARMIPRVNDEVAGQPKATKAAKPKGKVKEQITNKEENN